MYIFVDEIGPDKLVQKIKIEKKSHKDRITKYSFCYFENDACLEKALKTFDSQLLPSFISNKSKVYQEPNDKNKFQKTQLNNVDKWEKQLYDPEINEWYKKYEGKFKQWLQNPAKFKKCSMFLKQIKNECNGFFILEVNWENINFIKRYGLPKLRELKGSKIVLHRYQIAIGNMLQNIIWNKIIQKENHSKLIILFLDDFLKMWDREIVENKKIPVKKHLSEYWKRQNCLQWGLRKYSDIFYDLAKESKKLTYEEKEKKWIEMTENGKKDFYDLLKPKKTKFNFHICASYLDSKISSFLWLNEIISAIYKHFEKQTNNLSYNLKEKLATENIIVWDFQALQKENENNFKKVFLGKVKINEL